MERTPHSGLQNKVALFSYSSLKATGALGFIRSFTSSEPFHLLFPVCQATVVVHGWFWVISMAGGGKSVETHPASQGPDLEGAPLALRCISVHSVTQSGRLEMDSSVPSRAHILQEDICIKTRQITLFQIFAYWSVTSSANYLFRILTKNICI